MSGTVPFWAVAHVTWDADLSKGPICVTLFIPVWLFPCLYIIFHSSFSDIYLEGSSVMNHYHILCICLWTWMHLGTLCTFYTVNKFNPWKLKNVVHQITCHESMIVLTFWLMLWELLECLMDQFWKLRAFRFARVMFSVFGCFNTKCSLLLVFGISCGCFGSWVSVFFFSHLFMF